MAGHPHNHDHHDDGCADDHHNHDDHHNYDDDHGGANHRHHHDGCAAARRCADTTGRLASCCTNSRHPNLHRLDHRRGDPEPVSPSAAEEELIGGVGGFVPVAVAQLA